MTPVFRRLFAIVALSVGALFVGSSAHAQSPAGKTEVLWLGQSCFRITTPGGKVILTDP